MATLVTKVCEASTEASAAKSLTTFLSRLRVAQSRLLHAPRHQLRQLDGRQISASSSNRELAPLEEPRPAPAPDASSRHHHRRRLRRERNPAMTVESYDEITRPGIPTPGNHITTDRTS